MKPNKIFSNIFVIGVFLIVGFGCKSIKSPFEDSEISDSTDPKTTVQTAYKKFMKAKSYHSVVQTKTVQAMAETEVKYIAPNKFHIINKMPNMKSEMIAIGNDSYNRINDGKWTKVPPDKSFNVEEMRGKMTEGAIASMKDFEFVGKETLDGKDTFVYKFNSDYNGQSSSKIWISADSGLPLKVDTDGSYNGTKLQMSIIYDYDKEIKIEAPI